MGMASVLALALDPVPFARRAGLEPYEWQQKVLRSDAQRILLNCCRQSGKSTVVAVLAAHQATYRTGSNTLIISPGERQSALVLEKVHDTLEAAGWPVAPRRESVTQIALANGSRVVALPSSSKGTTRGYTADLLLVDEASHVPDEQMADMAPVLAVSGGRLIALSTPFGSRGWWWQAYRDRVLENWEYHEIPVTQCPRADLDKVAAQRREYGDWWYQQEYLCQFKEASGALFREEDIQGLFVPEGKEWSVFS